MRTRPEDRYEDVGVPRCPRIAHVAMAVKSRAAALLEEDGGETPGVSSRAEDAISWADGALIGAETGRCAYARVHLKAALRYWRAARRRAGR